MDMSRILATLTALGAAANEDTTSETATSPPASMDEAYESILSTLSEIWRQFFGHLPLIAAGGLILIATVFAAWIARRIAKRLLARTELRPSLQELIDRMVMVVVWILGLMLAAMVVFPGLTPTKALGGLGLASVAIGFAFKDMFENFFAGVLLLWRFPFEPGDFIECNDILGEVERTTIRMTTIRKPTDELIVVPNSLLFKNPVRVITHREARRISIVAGVAYEADLEQVVEVIERAVSECESVEQDEPVQVFPTEFGASSMNIEVAWWTRSTPLGERSSRGEVVTAIKRALDENELEIPFPQRTLSFKEHVRFDRDGHEAPPARAHDLSDS